MARPRSESSPSNQKSNDMKRIIAFVFLAVQCVWAMALCAPPQRFYNLQQLAMTPADAFAMPLTVDKENVNTAAFYNIARREGALHVFNNGAACRAASHRPHCRLICDQRGSECGEISGGGVSRNRCHQHAGREFHHRAVFCSRLIHMIALCDYVSL